MKILIFLLLISCGRLKKLPELYNLKKVDDRYMSYYLYENQNSNKAIIFIHGSPGSKSDYSYYMQQSDLKRAFSLMSIDRPGYEDASLGVEKDLKKQAHIIHKVIQDKVKNKKIILVGHSFGGPLIAQIASNYPDNYQELVFLAASLDPSLEKITWYQKLANLRFIRWLIPKKLDTCNQEIMALKPYLEKIDYGEIKVSKTILHGKKDSLVPIENVDFMKKRFKNARYIIFEDENHFIPWTKKSEITSILLNMAN